MNKEEKYLEKPNSPKDLALIIKKTPIVVIKLSACWCGPCKNKKFLESYQEVKSAYSLNNKVKFVELDVDDDMDIIEDKKYYNIDVNAIPTFLISRNGSFVRKYEGGGYLNEINDFIYNFIANQ
jgi:thiol-disulfide isomerase/thioredoxin